ncbi:single-stranded-DNA-specific exonuclease RecJ [Oceanobacillus sp. 1P07AA]|uniref:single-stranded-DNA-specific exonuclease RecJ n=1 Tax=Oceanobacillus sp. 1P07AA TaxID=3132293 RepID=UPI0039A775F0
MLDSKMKWRYNQPIDDDKSSLLEDLDISPLLKQLFIQRGVTTNEEVQRFLSPQIDDLHQPFLLKDMEKAVQRVHKAIQNEEKILVFGDYDADGVSSTVVMLKALAELGAKCDFYIPNRFTEGYGPNESAFRMASDQGYNVIITVDTGITSVHEANIANELGMDLIITDHHEPQTNIPECFAIIHPKCSPSYPFKELAGVGVALKFAEALLGYFPSQLLSYAAIGTIADLVPLFDENRVLSYYGLKELRATTDIGLKALIQVCQIEDLDEQSIGFSIGPRLNAVGRLQDADLAVELLLTEDMESAMEMANEINKINDERKKVVQRIVSEADQIVSSKPERRIIVVSNEGWNQGVLGIVASHLVRKYDRPAIVLSTQPELGVVKGSARSIPAFDLFEGCMRMRDLFTHFGGHSQAAGMTLPIENVDKLEFQLDHILTNEIDEEDLKQELEISGQLNIENINLELIRDISKLAPFGMKNPKPVFQIKEIPVDIKRIGSQKNHLKMQFRKSSTRMDAIGFGWGDVYNQIAPQTPIKLAGELSINEWNGNQTAQLMIQDMKIDEWQLFDFRGKRRENIIPRFEEDAIIISNQVENLVSEVSRVSYNRDIIDEYDKCKTVYIYELPKHLDDLKYVINYFQPKKIVACYEVESSNYLFAFPSREEFVWYYALIKKQGSFYIHSYIEPLKQHKGWNDDKINFMSEVFSDLGFVRIEDGKITALDKPPKKDLSESTVYQSRKQQSEIEKQLYYSNYEDLRKWFMGCMDYLENPREEVTHGI